MRYTYLVVAVTILCVHVFSVLYAERLLSETIHHDALLLRDYSSAFTKNSAQPTNVISWHGKNDLKRFMQAYFHEKNLVCDIDAHVTLLNITFGCNHLYENSGLGSGNFVAAFYAIRLAAKRLGNIDVSIHCPDASREQGRLLLPWLMGYFPASHTATSDLGTTMDQANVHRDNVCDNIDKCPIGFMFPDIQYELRRMAVALVGLPEQGHPSHSAVKDWLPRRHDKKIQRESTECSYPCRILHCIPTSTWMMSLCTFVAAISCHRSIRALPF